ncbi:MAG: hypothetical protein ACO3JL_04900 [Myxococcota bacterium]
MTRMPGTRFFWALSFTLFGCVGATGALAAEPYRILVERTVVAEGLPLSEGAVTSTLCAALSKRTGLEVMCRPDIETMLEAHSLLAMTRGDSPHLSSLQDKLDNVEFVARPFASKAGGKLKVLVRLYHVERASSGLVALGRPAGRVVEQVAFEQSLRLLGQLAAAAGRIEKMLYEPRNAPPREADPPSPL